MALIASVIEHTSWNPFATAIDTILPFSNETINFERCYWTVDSNYVGIMGSTENTNGLPNGEFHIHPKAGLCARDCLLVVRVRREDTGSWSENLIALDPSAPDTVHELFAALVDHVHTATIGTRFSIIARLLLNMGERGAHKVIIYNDSYIPIASTKHPGAFGSTCAVTWSEFYADAELAMRKAEASRTYFQGNFVPILSSDGKTEGYYNSGLETTAAVISSRRTKTLLALNSSMSKDAFWHDVIRSFEPNGNDVPLAVIYSLEHQTEGNPLCKYQASIGIDHDHPSLLPCGDLQTSQEGLIPYFREAFATRGPLSLPNDAGMLADRLFKGNHWRGFEIPSSRFVVLPLSAGEGILGFLFWGLNPCRPHDEDTKQFVELLSRQLQSSLTSTDFFEQARLNQKKLETDLALAESRFKTMAELNASGMYYISPRGELLYGNDTCMLAFSNDRQAN
ncbi:MAG: hypothetical protein Q9226_005415 [Calogaya cf. arnoldii]